MDSNRKVGGLDPKAFGRRVAAYLRERYPQKTAQNVEADCRRKIPAETVSKWLEGVSAPSGPYYQILINVYGAELVDFVDPDASHVSLRDAARRQRQDRLERQIASTQQKLDALRGPR